MSLYCVTVMRTRDVGLFLVRSRITEYKFGNKEEKEALIAIKDSTDTGDITLWVTPQWTSIPSGEVGGMRRVAIPSAVRRFM